MIAPLIRLAVRHWKITLLIIFGPTVLWLGFLIAPLLLMVTVPVAATAMAGLSAYAIAQERGFKHDELERVLQTASATAGAAGGNYTQQQPMSSQSPSQAAKETRPVHADNQQPQRGQDAEAKVLFAVGDRGTRKNVAYQLYGEEAPRRLEVLVPVEAVDGTRLRLAGQGYAGDPPGDLYLNLRLTQPEIDYDKTAQNYKEPTRVNIPTRAELTASIQERVIGHAEPIADIVRGVIGRLNAKKASGPYVFLLPGPTGTGKTELAKAVASAIRTELVRFDCGEFHEKEDAKKLFGSATGYVGSTDPGKLPDAIRKHQDPPLLVVLFDEVEKAHKDIWQQLLAFLDEGRATDNIGTAIAPKNTLVFMTTNLAADEVAAAPDRAQDIIEQTRAFSPELFGRIEQIVPVPRLSLADSLRLTHRLIDVLGDQYGMTLEVSEAALEALYARVQRAGDKRGGRGLREGLRKVLIDELLDLQADGATMARVITTGEEVHVIR